MLFNEKSTVLLVAAHPDDEVLGCGGTLARLTNHDVNVHVAFLADGISSRIDNINTQDSLELRRKAAIEACTILGTHPPSFDELPDNQLDMVPLLEITQKVEKLIERYQPDTILTHHGGDLNIDHRRIHQAVITACRPTPGQPVRKLLFFEVASSTEWQITGSHPAFTPDVFIDISNTLDTKLSALSAYEMEMRPWPHARSAEAIAHHARWRGASAGMEAAEAFILGRILI
jgi:LmbE family N-acetylglucosaminyl deacetylase